MTINCVQFDDDDDVRVLVCQHQQQVAAAVERAKQVTMQELNAIIGVSQSSLSDAPIATLVTFSVVCNVRQWSVVCLPVHLPV